MNPASDPNELHRLFMAKADGEISAADHERLNALLRESAETRRQWYAFQDVESALFSWSQREQQGESPVTGMHQPGPAMAAARRPRPLRTLLAASVLFTCVFTALTLISRWLNPPAVVAPGGVVEAEEATTTTVAVLTRGVNLEWESDGVRPALNAPLAPGTLKLKRGVAEIEFFQGARLCVEGPAEIKLVSTSEAFCTRGRFSAHVPPQAKGFRLGTPNGDVVDLGTDFGLDLNSDTPEVHVFKGEVELHQPETAVRMLTQGEAAGFEKSTPARALVASDAAFAFSRDLDSRINASQKEAFESWQQRSQEWNADPRLKARLDFQDEGSSRSLRNVATQGQDIGAGSIVGCVWNQGRWPEKRALQFRSLSDRVRLSVPGEFRQITLATWVQLHGLNVRQSSICMSQGIEAGYLHWQILHDGALCLGVGAGTKPVILWDDYISPVVFTPERFGQWVHLAVVYDVPSSTVTFYVDGERLSQHPVKRPTVLTPDLVELGNWTPSSDKRQQPVRNFAGCMDEFSLYNAALSPGEIRNLAE
ncbi:MAG: LamG-like jellyroll fold domain-containing protein [Verrucomicrobium sp.]|nr:LamG-like jellyroll fold domain-containing protein [Verrucomicrobium sp.]